MSETKERAPNGEGHLFQRGNVWWMQVRHHGKRLRRSTGQTSKAKAKRELRRVLGQLEAGRFVPNADKVTFDDLVTIFEQDYRLNERRSLHRAQRCVAHLRTVFGFDRAIAITADRIAAYAGQRKDDGAATATIANELSTLKRMFSLAIRLGRLTHKPTFPALHVRNARKGYFERGELVALLPKLPAYMVNLTEFGYLTGWRMRSELIGKKEWTTDLLPVLWRNVDFNAGIVRLEVGETKNEEGRTFPFAVLPPLQDCLVRQRAYTREWEKRRGIVIPWVFHRDGIQMRDFPYAAWRGACERAGLNGKIGHDFRRTAVRNLVRAGVPEKVAMQLTGHKTRSVFDRYDIVNEADLRAGAEKLAAYHATQSVNRQVLPMRQVSGGTQ